MATKDNSRTGNQQGSQGGNKNPGNFANDREKASRAGRKGAQNQPREAKAMGGRNSRRGSRRQVSG